MNGLVTLLVSNAVVVACGAVLLLVVGRKLGRKPALLHACWLILLIKLVTPSLVELPVLPPIPTEAPSAESSGDGDTLRPAELSEDDVAFILSMMARAETEAADDDRKLISDAQAATPSQSIDAESPHPLRDLGVTEAIFAVWLFGAVVAAWRALRRVAALRSMLRATTPAPRRLVLRLRRVADRLRLRRVPELRLLDARTSPFLASSGRRAVMVFPRGILEALSGRELETLMTHELAHFARRDHAVRWLELVTEIVHWWNPVAPLVRRELRRAEEECCDAWVVSSLPGSNRSYAKALLTCIDHMSGAELRIAAATAVGRMASLKRRVRMIMEGTDSGRLARSSRAMLLAAALLILPVAPTLAQTLDLAAEEALASEAIAVDKAPEKQGDDEHGDLVRLARIVEHLEKSGLTEVARDLSAIRSRMIERIESRRLRDKDSRDLRAHAETLRREIERHRHDAELTRLHAERSRFELERRMQAEDALLATGPEGDRNELTARINRLERGFDEMKSYFERLMAERDFEKAHRDRAAARDRDRTLSRKIDFEATLDAQQVALTDARAALDAARVRGDEAAVERLARRVAELEDKVAAIRAEIGRDRGPKRSGEHERAAKDARLEAMKGLELRIRDMESEAAEYQRRGEIEKARVALQAVDEMIEELRAHDPHRRK